MKVSVRKVKKEISVDTVRKTVEELLIRDGYLVPVIFVCDRNEANIIDISEGMQSDEGKDEVVKLLVDYIEVKKAYKVIMVSECWAYKAPDGMTREQIDEVIELGKHRHDFDKEEMYQIIEITADNIALLTRSFKKEDGKTVLTGSAIKSDQVELVRFKPIQDVLSMVS